MFKNFAKFITLFSRGAIYGNNVNALGGGVYIGKALY